ncbi:MAG: DUF2723 domain-containing protein [Deltaproteobacteria bacterium]|nr:DUF2723 domain-containing protein [Deltaproteobacteria bacterium]
MNSHTNNRLPLFIFQIPAIGSFVIPLWLGIINASSWSYWLDSSEFTAAVQTLGIAHPPGHPLYILLSKPFTLLPFGTIGLRVSLASAVFGALASFVLYKITLLVLRHASSQVPDIIASIIALSISLLTFSTKAFWFQSVRQEVYSLQALLVFSAILPVIKYALLKKPEASDIKLLQIASFIFGLGLSNHHFIMFAALPAALPALIKAAGPQTKNPLIEYLKMGMFTILGLLPYLFIIIRSMSYPEIGLGAVYSVKDFIWVITAAVYQKSMTKFVPSYLMDSPIDGIFSVMNELGPIIVVCAFAGFYLLLRRKSTRVAGITIFIGGATTLMLRAYMGFDPYNPDYYGYIMPAIALMATAFGVFVFIIIHVIYNTFKERGKYIAPVLAMLFIILPAVNTRNNRALTNLSGFSDTRAVYDSALKNAETGTVVISSYYKLFFLLWTAKQINGSRPDIKVVNPMFFGYPGYLASITKKMPVLKELAWSVFVKGEVSEKALSSLAEKFPVLVDPSIELGDNAWNYLLPHSILYRATPYPVGVSEIKNMAVDHFFQWSSFYSNLKNGIEEHETWRFLSWSHYRDALFFAKTGDRESALKSIEYLHNLGTSTRQVNDLEDAVKQSDGPVDITPYMLLEQSDPGEKSQ